MVEMTGLHIMLNFLQLGCSSNNGGYALKAGFGGVLPTHSGDDWLHVTLDFLQLGCSDESPTMLLAVVLVDWHQVIVSIPWKPS
jgi:hypothetical protein